MSLHTAGTPPPAISAGSGQHGSPPPPPPPPPDDRVLSALVDEWVQEEFRGDDVRRGFIRDEFEGRLWSYSRTSRYWRGAQISIWALIAVFGLLITIFAGYKTGHGFTIVAGALIAMLTTFSNSVHPAQKADGYGNARLNLRDEGWTLLNGTGDYAPLKGTPDAMYTHFADTISQIVATMRQNTTLDGLAPSG
jgi:hypothetical protein